jgi:lysozyme
MKTSPAGIEHIKRFEALRLGPYHDAAGFPTIGYGHLLSRQKWADLSQWNAITEDVANEFLMQDLAESEAAVSRLVHAPLSQAHYDALVSFTFNLGAGALQASTLRRVLNRGEYPAAPRQFMRWIFAGGRKLNGLVRRRKAETVLGMMWSEPNV